MLLDNFINLTKTGTLIIGYYRCGTHFLEDSIQAKTAGVKHGEVTTVEQLRNITKSATYNTCIVNIVDLKFELLENLDILDQWHVVRLSRNDKVGHYISKFFWDLNCIQRKREFKHHGSAVSVYENYQDGNKVHVDFDQVKRWFMEGMINSLIPCQIKVDYSDLPLLENNPVKWDPNNYNNIKLSDIFVEANELQRMLEALSLASNV